MDERALIEKLKRIQALHTPHGRDDGGGTGRRPEGYERVTTRLAQEQYEVAVEYKFSMTDHFQRRLFMTLARRHGLRPFRYKRQRRTTVMVNVSARFVDKVLWPEYLALSETPTAYLDEVTNRVISQAVHADQSDAPHRTRASR